MDAQPVREAELVERGGRILTLKRQIEVAGEDQLRELRRQLRRERRELRALFRQAQLKLFSENET